MSATDDWDRADRSCNAVARLEAIARGFMDLGVTDGEQLRLEPPVYDGLYAWAKGQVREA